MSRKLVCSACLNSKRKKKKKEEEEKEKEKKKKRERNIDTFQAESFQVELIDRSCRVPVYLYNMYFARRGTPERREDR